MKPFKAKVNRFVYNSKRFCALRIVNNIYFSDCSGFYNNFNKLNKIIKCVFCRGRCSRSNEFTVNRLTRSDATKLDRIVVWRLTQAYSLLFENTAPISHNNIPTIIYPVVLYIWYGISIRSQFKENFIV